MNKEMILAAPQCVTDALSFLSPASTRSNDRHILLPNTVRI
jgi:hypothetical protein